ncbi:hypothetical protein FBQ85_01540 [Cytophagia bacterium CHB2]|nr:hypothetical protein [Cytophagia bacterium CHB2]
MAILVLLLGVNHAIIEYLLEKNKASLANWLLSQQEKKEYDAVILGSSSARAAINVHQFSKAVNQSVISLASAGVAYPEQYLIWELFLRNNKTKSLILAADYWGLSDYGFSYPYHEYQYMHRLDNEIVLTNLEDNYGKSKILLWQFLPMSKYAEFNAQIGLHHALINLMKNPAPYNPYPTNDNRKKLAYDEESAASITVSVKPSESWDENREKYFLKILQLSRDHNVQLFLFISPVLNDSRIYDLPKDKIIDYYAQKAKAFGAYLFNINGHELTRNPNNFVNVTHLNSDGAKVFTDLFAQFLLSKRFLAIGQTLSPQNIP